jgi:hypothetical protein
VPKHSGSLQTDNVSLQQWIAHVFDHPVTDPAWHWATDAPELDPAPGLTAQFIAETFERAGELLASFSDAQINQGLYYMISARTSDYMFALTEKRVPRSLRFRVLRSFVPLFEQIFAVRCSSHLSHLDEQPANPLNAVCYMWWDVIPFHGQPEDPDRTDLDTEALTIMRQQLALPHDACRESALHGLGHWQMDYPDRVGEIIDELFHHSHYLRPELVSYAEQARIGQIQ